MTRSPSGLITPRIIPDYPYTTTLNEAPTQLYSTLKHAITLAPHGALALLEAVPPPEVLTALLFLEEFPSPSNGSWHEFKG